ncbi:Atg14 domain-containing protein [Pararhizobium sp. BT-229]|uniref:Atg14 domain-containing protein n=1 Tax=Pararhizobium sp. BT-229 TaxID=2986923 RepID=UPI0021F7BD08|nr:Atg14 domain-containing protein [Pararhizobium sp. BT-229]MCV9965120.1 Atg14 domain-containing protein [Pararhizobium sp. BT-229]
MIRTFGTRLTREDDRHAAVLDACAGLMTKAERKILAWLKAEKDWTAESYAPVYRDLGLSSAYFRMARASLDGKLKSVSEAAKLRVTDLDDRISHKTRQIASKKGGITKAKNRIKALAPKIAACDTKVFVLKEKIRTSKTDAARQRAIVSLKQQLDKRRDHVEETEALAARIEKLWFDIHQHTRKTDSLEYKRELAKSAVSDPSICFGTKDLFLKQFELEANGYASIDEWRKEWRAARSSGFGLVGASAVPSGNEMARLKLRGDGLFNLELRLPPALKHMAERCFVTGGNKVYAIDFRRLSFNHGHDAVVEAMARKQPISFRFCRDGRSWRIHVVIDEVQPEPKFDDRMGCLGVDFNADHVAATLADRFGNPVRTWTIPLVTYGKTSDQTLDAARKAAAELAAIAIEYDVPVASENLDFTAKKQRLRDDHGPAYARMLSSLAYSSFDAALASACCRSGVWLKRINPAFTSLIGRVKFAPRYGLSVHAAAALSIARRAMGASERMPAPVGGELKLPLDGGGHVTLPRPARIVGGHVWTSWRRLNIGWKTALAARGRTGRKSRSPATDPLPKGLGSAPRRRNCPPSPVGQVRGAPG